MKKFLYLILFNLFLFSMIALAQTGGTIRGTVTSDINSVPVAMIISADFFTAAQTPPEHRTAGAHCGTLQIQTRGR